MKTFHDYCLAHGVALAKHLNDSYDGMLCNAAYSAPGKLLDLTEIWQQKYTGKSGLFRRFYRNRKPKFVVYRSDGFRASYAGLSNDPGDCIQRCMLQLADHVVFQNTFTLEVARQYGGFMGEEYTIIHNGIDQTVFRMNKKEFWDGKRPLRFITCNWSKNVNKGYPEVAAFSLLPGVECDFIGNWPKEIDPGRVKLHPVMSREELAGTLGNYDVFLHPSKYDSCPNVCLEAISCGLPVVYHKTGGVGEVAGDCGWEYCDEAPQETLARIQKEYPARLEALQKKRTFFSIERCAKEYLTIMENISSRKRMG